MLRSVTLSSVGTWLGVKIDPKLGSQQITSISTDSRDLKANDLFVALKGDNFDGNTFVDQALEKGALAVICERKHSDKRVIPVTDSLKALVEIGSNIRKLFKGPLIGITGSAGKSSTKEMTATLLGNQTIKSPASFNNLIGVSKTCTLITDATKYCVLEMGMNAAGEIKELCEHFNPEYGLITNIGNAHIGKLGGVEGIRLAKKELFDHLAEHGKGIALNVDDDLIVRSFEELRFKNQKIIRYSLRSHPGADVILEKRTIEPDTGHLRITIKINGERSEHTLPLFGLHHGENLAAAVSAGLLVGASPKEILSRLPAIQPASHRGEIHVLKDDMLLIDESYNSNPKALLSSVESLADMAPNRRRILVIGDMLELGDFSEKLHRETGETIARMYQLKGLNFLLIGVGKHVAALIEGVKKHSPQETIQCANADEGGKVLLKHLQPNDIVMVKSSRGGYLDKIVTEVLEESL